MYNETNKNTYEGDERTLFEKTDYYNRYKKSTKKPFFYVWIISLVLSIIFEAFVSCVFSWGEVIFFHVMSSFIWIPICSLCSVKVIEDNHKERVNLGIETPEQRGKDIADELILGTTAFRYMNEGRKFSIKPKNEEV